MTPPHLRYRPRLRKRPVLLIAATLVLLQACAPGATSHVVVLVRHAERASEPAGNPGLTPEGEKRAVSLAERLDALDIDHIITSHLDRTILTAWPVAEQRDLDPEIVPVSGSVDNHIQAVARAVRARPEGEAILVVGHSNTIPAIVHALGGPDLPQLDEDEYSNLYIVLLNRDGTAETIQASFD